MAAAEFSKLTDTFHLLAYNIFHFRMSLNITFSDLTLFTYVVYHLFNHVPIVEHVCFF